MNTHVTFTHMFTGKTVTVIDKKSVAAVIHGVAKTETKPNGVECTFILIDGVASPMPVAETEEEVLTKLGLSGPKQETNNE